MVTAMVMVMATVMVPVMVMMMMKQKNQNHFLQKINETKISDSSWNKSHWSTLKQFYSQSCCWKETKDFIQELYSNATSVYLSEINYHFLEGICKFLKIVTPIRFSSEFILAE